MRVRGEALVVASWVEIEGALWIIPAHRTKMRREHRIPLSRQAVAKFETLKTMTGRGSLCFPSIRSLDKPLSDSALNAALRAMGIDGATHVNHGFRSSASSLLDEHSAISTEAIERALAHGSYNRAQYWDERVSMMQCWADYLDRLTGAPSAPTLKAGQADIRYDVGGARSSCRWRSKAQRLFSDVQLDRFQPTRVRSNGNVRALEIACHTRSASSTCVESVWNGVRCAFFHAGPSKMGLRVSRAALPYGFMHRFKSLLAALYVSACASSAQLSRDAPSAQPIIAAERTFAADAARHGWLPAFRAHAAAEAVVLAPALVNAHESLAGLEDDGDTSLQWWPTYAGIARSGEFGFTTGPAVSGSEPSRLQYFTVWRRQADGVWKWIYDGGAGAVDRAPPPRDFIPAQLTSSARGLGTVVAIAEVRMIESRLQPGDTLEPWLSADARVNRGGLAPVVGRDGFATVLNRPGLPVRYTTLRLEASEAGDMVFTLGEAQWTREGQSVNAHYARIWQLREEGWRIVFDQIM